MKCKSGQSQGQAYRKGGQTHGGGIELISAQNIEQKRKQETLRADP